MNFLHCIFILLFPVILSYPHRDSSDFNDLFNIYMKPRERNFEETNRKFGSPRHNMRPFLPSFSPQKVFQSPLCLPRVWSCAPNLPPCCPGLMCYSGNAKRGQYCVARG
ncbi:unnamed protein product [Rotaria socialis]|uniref:Uncharacterized protein n=1 Tax=Rotaria socialis TaxID=392032 RepID=A0A820TSE5_9BILA|nr:unnamed protein product [Rotaria socialis]CAF3227337.1 unnamed protein product [Rotaria socialis]CAF3609691.1 unnamed protein product [Rotaria socialis]CAF3677180.1 unnamed protein product [Rotaria socialis]CAF4196873.1 unnamed protein product [Rotaria socialis]